MHLLFKLHTINRRRGHNINIYCNACMHLTACKAAILVIQEPQRGTL